MLWVGFTLIFTLLAIDGVRTGVVATANGRYHRAREPRRYWMSLIFFGVVALLLGAVGVAVVVRDGVDAFVPVHRDDARR